MLCEQNWPKNSKKVSRPNLWGSAAGFMSKVKVQDDQNDTDTYDARGDSPPEVPQPEGHSFSAGPTSSGQLNRYVQICPH